MSTEDELFEHLKYRIVVDGNTTLYFNHEGQLHRDEGPALIVKSKRNLGIQAWFQHGERHRTDGPAIETCHEFGGPCWYLDGVQYTEEEYNKEILIRFPNRKTNSN